MPKKHQDAVNKFSELKSIENHKQGVDILIIDDAFPHPLSAFRMQEFMSYLMEFRNLKIYCSGLLVPFLGKKTLDELVTSFREKYPEYAPKINILKSGATETVKLIYLLFLRTAYRYIDAIEEAEVPFIFTLYPGGQFGLNNAKSDIMLQRVTSSFCFRKVIVTQRITYDYLIEKKFCRPDQIEYIFGVVTPLTQITTEYTKKTHFGIGKNILDICFVAHKYTPKGTDKGYDVFIKVARMLCNKHENIRLHVVGGFDENVIDVSDIRNRITFYGTREMEWFDEFYKDKDIILSPNVPYTNTEGVFDGFPTGACVDAGLRKTAIFCTDELGLNTQFLDLEEIVIIPHDAPQIVDIIEKYYGNPEKLKTIAENGCHKIKQIYSFEVQMQPRIKILKKELDQIQSSKRITLQLEKSESKMVLMQQVKRELTTLLVKTQRVMPRWSTVLLKNMDQKIRSNKLLFSWIKRLTPKFVIKIYLKIVGHA